MVAELDRGRSQREPAAGADKSLATNISDEVKKALHTEMDAFTHDNMRSGGLFSRGLFR